MHIHYKTLQNKLFTSYSLIFITSLIIILFILQFAFSRNIGKNAEITQTNLCSSIVNSTESELDKMNTISMNVVYSNLIRSNFKALLELEVAVSSDIKAVQKWDNMRMVYDMITAIVGPFQTVSQVNLYSLDGTTVGTGMLNIQKTVNLKDQAWYSAVEAGDGNKFITLPTQPDYSDKLFPPLNGQKFISLIRLYHDQAYRPEGIVEVMQDCETMFNFVSETKRKNPNTDIYIIDFLGNQIYPYDANSQINEQYYLDYIKNKQLNPLGNYTIQSQDGLKEVMTYDVVNVSKWYVIIVDSANTLYAPIYRYTLIIIIFSLVVLIVITIISYITAKKISVPLKNLSNAFSEFTLADLLSDTAPINPLTSGHVDEIESLNHAFIAMGNLLRTSSSELIVARTEEVKAKMLALQSMMNPHFLHNNLMNISVMAEENMNQEIIALCNNVSHILRYISSDESKGVSLQTELDYTLKYLECMKIRTGDKLNYTIYIQDELKELMIPKLIVQPLVENSIQHGFNKQAPWKIHIHCTLLEDIFEISVIDNGVGFDPDFISKLQASMKEIQNSKSLTNMKIGGMGLANVFLRLYLTWGDGAELSIQNAETGGSIVTLRGHVSKLQEAKNENEYL